MLMDSIKLASRVYSASCHFSILFSKIKYIFKIMFEHRGYVLSIEIQNMLRFGLEMIIKLLNENVIKIIRD